MAGQWDAPRADDSDPVFGTKQKQFDDEADGDKVPVRRRANAIANSAEYHARHPEPNYSQFKPQFVDAIGREYQFAHDVSHNDDDILDNEEILENPLPLNGSVKAKRVLLYLRMPISQKHTIPLPDPVGEVLELFEVRTQVLSTAKTDGVFVAGPRTRTGMVFVSDFVSHGQVSDPKPYEIWLRGDAAERSMF